MCRPQRSAIDLLESPRDCRMTPVLERMGGISSVTGNIVCTAKTLRKWVL